MSAAIKFSCSHCGQVLEVAGGEPGREVVCPSCGYGNVIPHRHRLSGGQIGAMICAAGSALLFILPLLSGSDGSAPYIISGLVILIGLIFFFRASLPEFGVASGMIAAVIGAIWMDGLKLLIFGLGVAIIGALLLILRRLPLR